MLPPVTSANLSSNVTKVLFPGACRPNKSHGLPRLDLQVHIFQNLNAGHIVEVDVLVLDTTFDYGHLFGIVGVLHVGPQVDDFEDSDSRRHSPLKLAVLHGKVPHRLNAALNVHGEGKHDRPVKGAAEHTLSTKDYDHTYGESHQELNHRVKGSGEPAGLHVGVEIFLVESAEVLQVLVLPVEALHYPNARYVLVVLSVDHCNGPSDAHEGLLGEPLPVEEQSDENRQHGHAYQGQLPVYEHHDGPDSHQAEHVSQALNEEFEGFLNLNQVAGVPRHNSAYLRPVEEGWRQPLKVPEHLVSKVVEDCLAHPGHEGKLNIVGHEVNDHDRHEYAAHNVNAVYVPVIHEPVDAHIQHKRQRHVRCHIHQNARYCDRNVKLFVMDILS